MAISVRDLVDFAASVIRADASETTLRAAISRSYYGAFHALAPFVAQLPKSQVCPPTLDRLSHREVIERITEWKTADVHQALPAMTGTKAQLQRHVNAAYHSRVSADYRLSYEITLADAQTQLERVKAILRHVQQIDNLLDKDNRPAEAGESAA